MACVSAKRLNSMKAPNLAKACLTGLYLRNLAANFSGNFIIAVLNIFTPLTVFEQWRGFLAKGSWVAIPILLGFIVLIAVFLQSLVQRPIAATLKILQRGGQPEPEIRVRSRRRLLNLPITLALVNFSMWIVLSAVLLPIMNLLIDMSVSSFLYGYFRVVMIGLIASFISFFLIDDYSRKNLIPVFFPEGKLAAEAGAVKISILRRIRVLMGVGTNAPMVLLVGTLAFAVWEVQDSTVSAAQFGREILAFVVVLGVLFVFIALSLNFLVGRSILNPIKEMMHLVYKVRDGNFHHKVKVVSNDELGVLGDGMNEMTDGLIERDRMRRSLYLAKEVQQALLPRKAPQIKGLDIAATSIYCDETGGDYYDFFGDEAHEKGKVRVVLGDVSGHGVSSALLMATARAFLRQRSGLPGSLSNTVADVNRQLAGDVEESGGFMTLFYLDVDAKNRKLSWVRAGHDPGIFYDPAADSFEELRGSGMALGVQPDAQFEENQKINLACNQVVILGTDGIWEARNPRGEMFGKQPLYQVLRHNSGASAEQILTACLDRLHRFAENRPPEDDVTMIVIKLVDD
jgi:sigma-B regulation protein RsbU (phosphoserine phosphatase)